MKKILKFGVKIFFGILISVILYLNISMYYNPTFDTLKGVAYNKSVYNQLQFLKEALHHGAGDEMQLYFPEGFMFINSLYGLSWCNLIKPLNNSTPIYQEGIDQINWAITQISTDNAKNIFDGSLLLENGAFYTGWSNYLIGSKLSIQIAEDRSTEEELEFKNTCLSIADALDQSEVPYLETYGGLSWPADMMSAVATLSMHDKIYEPKFEQVINTWINHVKQNLDSTTGLIPHRSDAQNGKNIGVARGSSQSLILNFLFEIDEKFAQEQFELYKKHFLDYRFGLPGIREYPKKENGTGDIDSGPIIWNIGGAASIVGQRTMFKFGDLNTYQGLRNSIEAFGLGYTSQSKKKYIFGKIPMADAFICWSNSIENVEIASASNWRLTFHFFSFFLILILIILTLRFK